jgi:hypothetical protein
MRAGGGTDVCLVQAMVPHVIRATAIVQAGEDGGPPRQPSTMDLSEVRHVVGGPLRERVGGPAG